LQRPNIPEALGPQDCLYTVEILSQEPQYRVVGVIRRALAAMAQPGEVLAALAAPETHVISLTVTEKGYCLGVNGGLDEAHPDIVHDLVEPDRPRSAIGWLVRGFAERCNRSSGPVTVISCDNLASNGRKLEATVRRPAGYSRERGGYAVDRTKRDLSSDRGRLHRPRHHGGEPPSSCGRLGTDRRGVCKP
jgi:fructuronate reductase